MRTPHVPNKPPERAEIFQRESGQDRPANHDVQNVTHSPKTKSHIKEELLVNLDHVDRQTTPFGNQIWRTTGKNPSFNLGGNQRIVVKVDLASAVYDINGVYISEVRA
jgi:hypothetical protein